MDTWAPLPSFPGSCLADGPLLAHVPGVPRLTYAERASLPLPRGTLTKAPFSYATLGSQKARWRGPQPQECVRVGTNKENPFLHTQSRTFLPPFSGFSLCFLLFLRVHTYFHSEPGGDFVPSLSCPPPFSTIPIPEVGDLTFPGHQPSAHRVLRCPPAATRGRHVRGPPAAEAPRSRLGIQAAPGSEARRRPDPGFPRDP